MVTGNVTKRMVNVFQTISGGFLPVKMLSHMWAIITGCCNAIFAEINKKLIADS